MNNLSGKTTIVVGASRGLGHGIATAFAEAGAPVVAVSRTPAASSTKPPAPAPSTPRSPTPVTPPRPPTSSTAMTPR